MYFRWLHISGWQKQALIQSCKDTVSQLLVCNCIWEEKNDSVILCKRLGLISQLMSLSYFLHHQQWIYKEKNNEIVEVGLSLPVFKLQHTHTHTLHKCNVDPFLWTLASFGWNAREILTGNKWHDTFHITNVKGRLMKFSKGTDLMAQYTQFFMCPFDIYIDACLCNVF